MPWRFIIAVLLLAAGASVWGGLELGNWLIAHGPEKSMAVSTPDPSDLPTLDADGKPFTAQPPQPLPNGRLGVPQAPTPIAWEIDTSTLTEEKPPIALATTSISLEQAIQIAMTEQNRELQGIARVNLGGSEPIQPVDVGTPPPPPPQDIQVAGNNNGAWQAQLQQELNACSQKGFFDRPSCSWDARNKYCGPNNAWGKVAGCPSKSF
ncbi:hypothetical protein OSH04_16015 [Alcaligenes sp. A-TC2]|uniref:Uncharacterized protein n=1 Tax=Alcaligenes faecalis TaxID=511 RepID=A0AAE9HBK7_ALCFA|nr:MULTISPECIES: hypothetical protein [Alcaligenes]MDH4866482.1 hypothetical protein [Bacillus cereus]KGP03663.1 hypothetical protein JT27_03405 [Alcaligenes faecalis]MCX5473231.1 hypothetical protein [Alcaligenes nematophilus]MDY7127782.1 hypothetical protein [Alcaligenes nematophilus]OQV29194.1 hypothetical protein BV899_18260 [Alcaligenes phenolicus]